MRLIPSLVPPGGQTVCVCRGSCWQPGTRTPASPGVSEDCLYLNVFVPENAVSSLAVAACALRTAPWATPRPLRHGHHALLSGSAHPPALSWPVLGVLKARMAESEQRVLLVPTWPCPQTLSTWAQCMVIRTQFSKECSLQDCGGRGLF